MTICHSSDSTFHNDLGKRGITIVNFWAPWCGPCQMFATVLEDYDSDRNDDVEILKINVDENERTTSSYGVMSLPTTILFKGGMPIEKKIGFMTKSALTGWVSSKKLK